VPPVRILDRWLPRYDVHEVHERALPVPPERALELALATRFDSDWIVRSLLLLRGLGATRGRSIGESFERMGFRVLERTPTLFVAGGGRRISIVLGLEARPAADGSVLSTETRVAAADRGARLAFRAYWLLVGPFSALIRRRWLRAAAIAAANRSAAPSP
jgi:hypothetical protein